MTWWDMSLQHHFPCNTFDSSCLPTFGFSRGCDAVSVEKMKRELEIWMKKSMKAKMRVSFLSRARFSFEPLQFVFLTALKLPIISKRVGLVELHCKTTSIVQLKWQLYRTRLNWPLLKWPGARFWKVRKTFLARKAIRKTPTRLLCKAGLFICCKGNKNKK